MNPPTRSVRFDRLDLTCHCLKSTPSPFSSCQATDHIQVANLFLLFDDSESSRAILTLLSGLFHRKPQRRGTILAFLADRLFLGDPERCGTILALPNSILFLLLRDPQGCGTVLPFLVGIVLGNPQCCGAVLTLACVVGILTDKWQRVSLPSSEFCADPIR